MEEPIVCGVTMGDMAGVGPEVILKALEEGAFEEVVTLIYGSSEGAPSYG